MRCQARLDFTNERRFRSGAERNVKQQMINTTLCHYGQTLFQMGSGWEYTLKGLDSLWIESILEI